MFTSMGVGMSTSIYILFTRYGTEELVLETESF